MAMTTGMKAMAAAAAAAAAATAAAAAAAVMQEAVMVAATVAAPAYGEHAADVSTRNEPIECAGCLSNRLRFFVLRSTL